MDPASSGEDTRINDNTNGIALAITPMFLLLMV
jgi:hypothetical protein